MLLEEGNTPLPPHSQPHEENGPFYTGRISSLLKRPKWLYEGQLCGKIDREGSFSKAARVLSKDESALRITGHFLSGGGLLPSSNVLSD